MVCSSHRRQTPIMKFKSTRRARLKTLERRAQYLQRLILEHADRPNSYEKAELEALTWAIDVLSGLVSLARPQTHTSDCASQGAIGGQGLEFIECDCKNKY